MLGLLALACIGNVAAQTPDAGLKVSSPNGEISFQLIDAATPADALRYAVAFHGRPLLVEAKLGLELAGQPALGPGMKASATHTSSMDNTYTIPLGKTSSVRDHYNALTVELTDPSGRKLTIEARVFDDGIGFRYLVPDQPGLKQVRIARELTQFTYAKDATTWPLVVDGYQSAWEEEYQQRLSTGVHSDWLIGLPLLAEEPGLGWVAITEANVDNFAGSFLRKDKQWISRTFQVDLSPKPDEPGTAVETATPFNTPWRVLMIGDRPGALIESNIVLNLNPPSKIADTSWVKPGKSAWDWWSGEAATGVPFKTGMNTATMEHYIDFASQSGFPYMLIDAGWALSPRRKNPGDYAAEADITQVTPEIDMPELVRYAKEKNVRIWLWSHWTSVDKYMDQAFPQFEKWGIAGVKIDFMNRNDQWMVGFYRRVVESAATHHLMIDFHGAYPPDGLRRTWPNLVNREGVMGKEYLKVTARVTPAHDATLPFTRMLAGPMDYTPGAFGNVTPENFVPRDKMPMTMNTRAHELALFVVLEAPLEMVSDYPEAYKGQQAFDFIKQVPTSWDEVRVLGGRPMQNITLARRSGKDWYVGSITNSEERSVHVPLNFLAAGNYTAEIYADAADAGKEPTHSTFAKVEVTRDTVLDVHMAPGGGNAIWIHPSATR